MADNYLEKKMEEHRKGTKKPMRLPKKTRAAFVTDAFSEPGVEVIDHLLAGGGCHIAFATTEHARGQRLAQAIGARCYCLTPRLTLEMAIADAMEHYRPLEVDIINT